MPGREVEFEASIDFALRYAKATDAKRIHVMAGVTGTVSSKEARATYIENLRIAADRFAEAGLELLIEPINPRDMPGYFLSSADEATAIIDEISAPNLKLQFDIYHHQITRGDVTRSLERFFPIIGHIQIAGVPDRHEPDKGELNYAHVFPFLDRLGYRGWIGCEYRPRGSTSQGLEWLSHLVK